MSTDFSVLMPVYRGDVPAHFARALRSVSTDQTRRPSEIVIVRDGAVSAELDGLIDAALAGEAVGGVPVTAVRLTHHRGLAGALSEGLKACRHEIVARADADDISVPIRFAAQLPFVAGEHHHEPLDLLGGAIREFEDDESQLGIARVLPTDADEIRRVARFRDPFNHPTVVYRRSAVDTAGGYQELARMEDYWLFARMLAAGARVANLAESVVLYRVGAGAYQRRGGLGMVRSELALQRAFVGSGFVSPLQGARNVLVRGGYRIVPTALRQAGYRAMLRMAGR
ncbi:Glycosyltransferase involved in cell wall bisynthesis [Propionibacterium cyclohexanicum]|uniref:Glycosyltransferase involved in cell wall bisynthesis n=1 Tax=Propionibacterium cyclohexanicum TaxID=64702 RepID=A0A1H9RN25_9ACTN|nr:glycosyltransferase [Propionibacterium cyclohexanicum]SER74311.1 Glycosyltransferase involved in cell wall bisynthesis [Propionibacterium cyclohexanicum]